MSQKKIEDLTMMELKEVADAMECDCSNEPGIRSLCLNHLLEYYVFAYHNPSQEFTWYHQPLPMIYRRMAQKLSKTGRNEEAEAAWQRGIQWNPLDLDTIFGYGDFLREQARWEDLKQWLLSCHPYLFSRTDLARFYRLLGCAYLEQYHPETARALYRYSNLFSPSKQADEELRYLDEAIGKKSDCSAEELQALLKKESLPVEADQTTMGMVYQLGRKELQNGDQQYGHLLLQCLYELTGDEEVGAMLS